MFKAVIKGIIKAFTVKRIFPELFSEQRQTLLQWQRPTPEQELPATLKIMPTIWPPKPIEQVDKNQTHIRHNHRALIRNTFILPCLLGLSGMCGWTISDFLQDWKGAEKNFKGYIKSLRRSYGNDFFEKTKDSAKLMMFNRIGADLKLSFDEYMYARYHHFVGGETQRYVDIFMIIIYPLGIGGLLLKVVRLKRPASVVFDRQRQCIYYWQDDILFTQHFDQLGMSANAYGVQMALFGVDKDNELRPISIPIIVDNGPFVDSNAQNTALQAFLTQFMVYGLDHLLDQPWQQQSKAVFFFEEKPPIHLDSELDKLLIRLNEENIGPRGNEQTLSKYG